MEVVIEALSSGIAGCNDVSWSLKTGFFCSSPFEKKSQSHVDGG